VVLLTKNVFFAFFASTVSVTQPFFLRYLSIILWPNACEHIFRILISLHKRRVRSRVGNGGTGGCQRCGYCVCTTPISGRKMDQMQARFGELINFSTIKFVLKSYWENPKGKLWSALVEEKSKVRPLSKSHKITLIWKGDWGVFKFFISGRMKSLWIELVELTPMPEWQTQMLLRCWEIYFWSSRRAVPIETVWEDGREKSYLTHSLMHEDTWGGESGTIFPSQLPVLFL